MKNCMFAASKEYLKIGVRDAFAQACHGKITPIPFDPSDPNNREKKVMVIDTRSVFLADQRLKKAPMQDYYLKAPIKIQGVLLYRGRDSQSNHFYKLRK